MDKGRDIKQPTSESEPPKHWSFDVFKTSLITAATVHPPTIKSLPETIDTGIFGEETDNLNARTLTDPQHREFVLSSKLNLHKRIDFQTEPTIGSQGDAIINMHRYKLVTEGDTLDRYTVRERYVLFTHSHPNESPASPTDIGAILEDLDSGGYLGIMVGTSGLNLLFLRTLETPEMTPPETAEWVEKWTDEYKRRCRKMPSYLTGTARLATASIINNDILREISQETKIVTYSAPRGRIYTRAIL
jgi:hypothetical protein